MINYKIIQYLYYVIDPRLDNNENCNNKKGVHFLSFSFTILIFK